MEKNAVKRNLYFIIFILFLLLLFLISFLLIANEMRKNELVQFDHSIISVVQGNISPVLTGIMEVFTFLGSTKWISSAVIFGIIILFVLKKWSLGIFLLLSSGIGSLFNVLLKNLFKRARPDIHPLISEHGYSFPSGHSMGSFIFYGSIAYIIVHYAHRKGWKTFGVIMMALLVLCIGTSRIYLGVHFPSDVIGGYTAGGAWLIICILSFRYYEQRKNL